VVTGGPQHDYRLKESFYLTRVEVRDREDTDGKRYFIAHCIVKSFKLIPHMVLNYRT